MATKLQVTGKLPIGIEINGEIHRSFDLSPVRVRHSIDAIEKHGDISQARLNLAVLGSRVLINGQPLSLDQMLDMHDDDLAAIYKLDEDLKKKLRPLK